MSAGELIGLIVTIGLLCTLITATVILVLSIRQHPQPAKHDSSTEAYERWLAARLSLSRASMSFVMAFRSLAAESKESPHYSLRMQEAQRARSHWVATRSELDHAIAAIIVRSKDPTIPDQLNKLDTLDAVLLRGTINGIPKEVQQFRDRLCTIDRDSIRWVQSKVRSSSVKFDLRVQPLRFLQSISDHWQKL